MRLRRIEAVRYGALENVSLGPLGDGLTVVIGPNEAGKSTLTALVGHVLYGFPTRAQTERGYHPRSGERYGRLVFEDASGEWAIERVGKTGGKLSVRTLRGEERPSLAETLTSGVTRQAFRVVFGFGLDELAAIEQRASNDDVLSRLYAAGAGLRVSPIDVQARIDEAAKSIFAPNARTKRANELMQEITQARKRIRELEDRGSQLADEQVRLGELATLGIEARKRKEEALARLRAVERDLERYEDKSRSLSELEDEMAQVNAEIDVLEQRRELIEVDEKVIAVAPELESVLQNLPAFNTRLETLARLEAQVLALEANLAKDAWRSPDDTPLQDVLDEAARRAERLTKAEIRLEQSLADSQEAAAVAEVAEAEAGQVQDGVAGSKSPAFAAWALFLVGIAMAGIGAFSRDVTMIVTGAFAGVLGAVALLRRPAAGALPLSRDGVRLLDRAHERRSEADSRGKLAERAAEDLEKLRGEWNEWLQRIELGDHAGEPLAVKRELELARERARDEAERASRLDEVRREREAAEAYAAALANMSEKFFEGPPPQLSEVCARAARVREMLSAAVEARDERQRIERQKAAHGVEITRIQTRASQVRTDLAAIAEAWEVAGNDSLAALESRVEMARLEHQDADEAYDALSKRHAELATELDVAGRENRLDAERQSLASLRARLDEEAASYAVLSMAARLLDCARERYERERQPDVVREAEAVFREITQQRYDDLRVPLGAGTIEVLGDETGPKTSDELSRGTAEQLYVALRIGLLRQLGDTGNDLPVLMDDILVNFDPERRRDAAAAIAELASQRQVVVFTCHPETAGLFAEAAPNRTILQLEC